MAIYTVTISSAGSPDAISLTDGSTYATLAVSAGRGPKGDGFTGGSYEASTGVVTFTSNDGIGFSTGDLRSDLSEPGPIGDVTPNTGAFAGLTTTTADINGGTIDGTVIGGTTPAAITGTTITGTSFVTTGDMTFGDNDKAIFGAGSDLQIYHDGSNSYVTDQGTGSLYLQGTSMFLTDSDGNEFIRLSDQGTGGTVRLFHLGAQKLATTSTGVDVTGDIGADTATISGDLTVDNNTLFVDASTNRVGIGTSSPSQLLEVRGQAAKIRIADTDTSGTTGIEFVDSGSNVDAEIEVGNSTQYFAIKTSASERMRIDSSGNVGIGTSSPGATLHVASGASANNDFDLRISEFLPNIVLEDISSGSTDFQVFVDGGAMQFLYGDASTDTKLANEAMRITSSGNVEIAEGTVVLNGNEINALQVTIADDAVAELTFPSRQGGLLWVSCEAQGSFPQINNFSGFVTVDFGNTPGFQTPIFSGGSFAMDTSGALTGTTGADGEVTVGVAGTNGTLYIENRAGANYDFQITLL